MREVTAAVRGLEFTNAYATASNTGSSMPTIAAGVYCDRVADGSPNLKLGETSEEDGVTTLAEAFSETGFECSLWSDNIIFGSARNYDRGFGGGRTGTPTWKKRAQKAVQRTGSDRLFDVCRWLYFNVFDRLAASLPTENSYYTPAGTHHESVLASLERQSGGQLHWVHYMDVHHPFDPPAEYIDFDSLNTERSPSELAELSSSAIIRNQGGATTDADVEDIEQAYYAACEHLRDQLVSFVERLIDREHFVPGHDLLVLTSDHGEGFDRDLHGMLGHTPTPSFWEDLMRVPLVISHPDWESGTTDDQVSLIDLVPTVLTALDVPVPESAQGRAADRPANLDRKHVYFTATGPYRTYHGVQHRSGWKLFADRISDADSVELTGSDETQDRERVLLTRVTDDGEAIRFERKLDAGDHPTDPTDRERWLDLHRRLRDERDGVATRRFDEMLTDETVQQLQELGYVDNIR